MLPYTELSCHAVFVFFTTGLREEFEMDSRLRKIESKLSMLQQNTNFFIEMLHNQKRYVLSTHVGRHAGV